MVFDLKKSQIYTAVVFCRMFPLGILKFYRIIFLMSGFILVGLSGIKSLLEYFTAYKVELYLRPETMTGLTYILLPFGFSMLFFELFGKYYLRYPKIDSSDPRSAGRTSPEASATARGFGEASNIAEFLEFEAADIFDRAYRLSGKTGETRVSTKTLLLAMLDYPALARAMRRLIPDFNAAKSELEGILDSANTSDSGSGIFSGKGISIEVMQALQGAIESKERHGGYRISILDILASMFDYNDSFRSFILKLDLDKHDLEELADWYEHIWNFWRERRKFWSLDNLLRQSPIGRDWVYGYSPYLNSFAVNLTDKMDYTAQPFRLMTREKEIEEMEEVLARSGQNNILIVGEEGVGKDRLLFDFTETIAMGQALPQLNYKKIFELNVSLITASSKDIADVQNVLIKLLNEATRSGNIILIIKDFHNFIGEIGGMGRMDISQVIVPYLKSANVQFIATTNPSSFHKFIETRSEISSVFERLDLKEADTEQTLKVLEEIIPSTEGKFGILVTYGAVKSIVDSADKYIRTAPFPEKAVDLLSEVVSYVVSGGRSMVTVQDVNEVTSRKTGIPLGPIAGEEKEKLQNLEKLMHEQLVGQERAVEVVSSTMRRLRTGMAKRGKPAGVFLFIGPTGVGKTLTAKILARIYYGAESRMIRFDMSEYQDIESLDRFLGNLRSNQPGQFVSMVRDNPFSLILLDELEKAHKNILNIFLQVFDEANLTDVFGRKVNFEQNIIIATSNAGAADIREMVQQGTDPSLEKEKVIDILIKQKYFTPEFLNRFDELVVFHPLTKDQIGSIAKILITGLVGQMAKQGYTFKPTEEVINYISDAGFDPQFGARPMQRVIRDKIENAIAKKILEKTIRKGEEFSLSLEDVK